MLIVYFKRAAVKLRRYEYFLHVGTSWHAMHFIYYLNRLNMKVISTYLGYKSTAHNKV